MGFHVRAMKFLWWLKWNIFRPIRIEFFCIWQKSAAPSTNSADGPATHGHTVTPDVHHSCEDRRPQRSFSRYFLMCWHKHHSNQRQSIEVTIELTFDESGHVLSSSREEVRGLVCLRGLWNLHHNHKINQVKRVSSGFEGTVLLNSSAKSC